MANMYKELLSCVHKLKRKYIFFLIGDRGVLLINSTAAMLIMKFDVGICLNRICFS